MFHEWNSIKNFGQYGLSNVEIKDVKKKPSTILLSHPVVFMCIDVINRFVDGMNVFEVYGDKYKLVFSNLQGDEDNLRNELTDIINTFYNTTNATFTSKVNNKYEISWQYITSADKPIEMIFKRGSKFVNTSELDKYINDKEQLSTTAYLLLYLLKDKTLKKNKDQFINAIITSVVAPTKPLIDFPPEDILNELPSDHDFDESHDLKEQIEVLIREKDELKAGYERDIRELQQQIQQIVQIIKVMKREIDSLKTSTSGDISMMLESFNM